MLVGRASELARCRAVLDGAVAGRAGVVEVVGDAGIGKTTLLREAGLDERFAVLRATGVEEEAVLSYAGLEALLRPLIPWSSTLSPHQRSVVDVLLGREPGPTPDPLSVVGTVLDLLSSASTEQPLLLLIDDVQWLDAPTRLVLGLLARRLAAERVAVLVAGRAEPSLLGHSDPLRLGPLSAEEAARLVHHHSQELSPAALDRLYQRSAGNPLCLVELADQPESHGRRSEPIRVPDRIHGAHVARLGALSEPARWLLTVLACAGRGETPTVLAAAAEGSAELDVAAALDELMAAGLVERTADLLSMRHPLLRESVIADAGPTAVREAHGALASVLGGSHDDRALWHRAANAAEPDEALAEDLTAYAERLAAHAQPDSARRALEAAATLSVRAEARAERQVSAVELSLLVLSDDVSATTAQSVREGALLRADLDLRLRVAEARTAMRRGHRRQAVSALLSVARDLPAAERGDVLATAVAAAIADRDPEAARSGLDLFDDGDESPFAQLAGLVVEYWSTPVRQLMPGRLAQALHRWRATQDSATLLVMRAVAMDAGELTLARSISEHAMEQARHRGDLLATAEATLDLAFCDHALSSWNSAAARAFEVTQLLAGTSVPSVLAEALLLLAEVDAARGLGEDCRVRCADVRRLAEQVDDPSLAILADRREALLDMPGDDPSAALPRLRAAHTRYQHLGLSAPYVSPVPDLVEVLVRTGQQEEARVVAPGFLASIGDAAPEPRKARSLRVRGLISGEDYDDLFDASVAADRAAGQLFHAARTMLCQGERRRREGRRVAARERLEEAREVFARLEAEPWRHRAERELVAAGAAISGRHRPAITQSLTNQELQIAALVAEGQRNDEIAAALFLSPKTVEFHLTRAYRKAGVRNRAQLASLMSNPDRAAAAPRPLSGRGSAAPG